MNASMLGTIQLPRLKIHFADSAHHLWLWGHVRKIVYMLQYNYVTHYKKRDHSGQS